MHASCHKASKDDTPALDTTTLDDHPDWTEIVNAYIDKRRRVGVQSCRWKGALKRSLRFSSSQPTFHAFVDGAAYCYSDLQHIIISSHLSQRPWSRSVQHNAMQVLNNETSQTAFIVQNNRVLVVFSNCCREIESTSNTQNTIMINKWSDSKNWRIFWYSEPSRQCFHFFQKVETLIDLHYEAKRFT